MVSSNACSATPRDSAAWAGAAGVQQAGDRPRPLSSAHRIDQASPSSFTSSNWKSAGTWLSSVRRSVRVTPFAVGIDEEKVDPVVLGARRDDQHVRAMPAFTKRFLPDRTEAVAVLGRAGLDMVGVVARPLVQAKAMTISPAAIFGSHVGLSARPSRQVEGGCGQHRSRRGKASSSGCGPSPPAPGRPRHSPSPRRHGLRDQNAAPAHFGHGRPQLFGEADRVFSRRAACAGR
jgi:hypothetical protein